MFSLLNYNINTLDEKDVLVIKELIQDNILYHIQGA